jgi:hypothetical protein
VVDEVVRPGVYDRNQHTATAAEDYDEIMRCSQMVVHAPASPSALFVSAGAYPKRLAAIQRDGWESSSGNKPHKELHVNASPSVHL